MTINAKFVPASSKEVKYFPLLLKANHCSLELVEPHSLTFFQIQLDLRHSQEFPALHEPS